ncbi:MAG: TRAP transporter large permease [Gammaproteobacteria bacterium]|nr:TRAP transporter large permease [Gammaproteobacteria bacterium]
MVWLTFVVLLLAGVPVALVLAVSALVYILSSDNHVLFLSYPQQLFSGLQNYGLLAIPLFMLTGELMNRGGATRRLVDMAGIVAGGFRGGLAYINLLANMMMASIIGSAAAQISIMSQVMVPEMERQGYQRDFAAATTAAGGLLSPIIPPSMLFVIYGVLAQLPIGELFIAGIVPGLLMAGGFFVAITLLGFRYNYPTGAWYTPREALRALLWGLPALCVPLVIIGGIILGIAAPTESAALAAVAALVIGRYVYRELSFSDMGSILNRTARNSALVMFLIAAANVFGWVILYEQIPQVITGWLTGLTEDPFYFLLLVMLLLICVGMVIDAIAALIIVVPILLPIAVGTYGLDPIAFGVIVCINLVLGLLTPPVGAGLFIASAMSGVAPGRLFLALLPFLVTTVFVLILLSWQPWLATALL